MTVTEDAVIALYGVFSHAVLFWKHAVFMQNFPFSVTAFSVSPNGFVFRHQLSVNTTWLLTIHQLFEAKAVEVSATFLW